MTAVDVDALDKLRETATAVLHANLGSVVELDVCQSVADALLPVVDRIANERAAAVLRAAAREQRNEAEQVPDTDEGTHADGHRCAADFLDRRANHLDPS